MGYIYKITNLINDKKYIGLTYRNVLTRWTEHKNRSKKGEHSYLYEAMRKYGIKNFKIEQIDTGFGDELKRKEKYWIKYYNTFNSENGYNLTLGGDGSVTIDYNQVYKLWDQGLSIYDISNKLKINSSTAKDILSSYKNFNEAEGLKRAQSRRSIKINQYTLKGKYLTTYNSITEASRLTGITKKSIRYSCTNNNKITNIFLWRFYNGNTDDIEPPKNYKLAKRKVDQYDLDNNFIKTYDSIANAARSLNLKNKVKNIAIRITKTCQYNQTVSSNYKTCYGYIWKYNMDFLNLSKNCNTQS